MASVTYKEIRCVEKPFPSEMKLCSGCKSGERDINQKANFLRGETSSLEGGSQAQTLLNERSLCRNLVGGSRKATRGGI